MIRKQNFKLNWKYALGELVLIFLGISLAIGFQNWNEERKKDILKKEVLHALYLELSQSLGDVNGDLDILQEQKEGQYRIMDAIEKDTPYDPNMTFDFYFIFTDEYTYPSKASYERIKNLGIEMISNDSLSTQIARLFEHSYPRISREAAFYPDIRDYFDSFFVKNFKPNRDMSLKFLLIGVENTYSFPKFNELEQRMETIGYVPNDFEALKQNSEFAMMLNQTIIFRKFRTRQYVRIKDGIENILVQIEQAYGKPDGL